MRDPKRRLRQRLEQVPVAGSLSRRARVRGARVLLRSVPGGSRHAFRVDVTAMFLAGLYTGAVFPFATVIARDDLKASPIIIATMGAAPFFGNLLALFWARAVEGRRKVPFVKWSWMAARFCILLALFAGGAWPFALVVSAAQVIGTIATPAYAAIIKDVYPDEQRGRLLSLSRAAILVAQVATTLGAGWLMTRYHLSYRHIFPVAAIVGMIAAVVYADIIPHEAPGEPDAQESPGPLNRPPSIIDTLPDTGAYVLSTLAILKEDEAFRWFAWSVFSYGFGNLLTVPIQPLIQVDELHITKAQLAVMFNAMQVVAIFSYFYWGRFVDRRSPQRAVMLNVLINTLVPLVYILSGAWRAGGAWVLMPAYLISGVVNAGIDISYFAAILGFSGPTNVTRYQALQSFLLGIRGSTAPFIGGFMAEALKAHHLDFRWAFGVGMILMLAGAWMQSVAMRKHEAREV